MMQRDVLWAALEDRGFEHLRLSISATAVNADGIIVRRDVDGSSYRAQYSIECDSAWNVRRVDITGNKHLSLTSDGQGHWLDASGHPVTALDGCFDVDILASPFTNTLAIRRLRLDQGAAATLDIVFIDPPYELGAAEVALTREALGWTAAPFEIPEPVARAWSAS